MEDNQQKGLVSRIMVSLRLTFHVLIWRFRYSRVLGRVRTAFGNRPLKVVFLVSECAKWKVQSLYELMLSDERFEPIVALTHADFDFDLPEQDRVERRNNNIAFFKKNGIPYEETVLPDLKKKHHLRDLKPDVVFYQHPYVYIDEEMPGEVARYALTCYIPYYVPNYGKVSTDCQLLLHRQLWRYFCLNETWASLFRDSKPWYKTVPEFVGLGHTMLDQFYLKTKGEVVVRDRVIYAPHWSFSYPGHDNFENYSTFPKNGKEILAYAKAHPEIKWAFKPHPTLKAMLYRSKIMTPEEIERYYAEWESIAESCYDGGYVDLFLRSRAMITDCGSFLAEYPCTGMPLIHLCSSNRKIETMEPSRRLFSSFYQVHNLAEMYDTFSTVLEKNRDSRKEERLAAVKAAGLLDNYAAKNILEYLAKEFSRR